MDPPSLGIPSWTGTSAPVGALPAIVAVARPLPTILHGHLPHVLPQSGPSCPDPDGLDKPPSPMGGPQCWGYGGPPSFFGGHPRFYGGSRSRHFSFPSSGLTANHWRTYTFPGGISLAVPSFIHGGVNPCPPCPTHGGSPHAHASVVSLHVSAAPPLCPLTHEDLSASLALDLTMSFWPSYLVAVAPLVVPSANVAPPLAPTPNVSPSSPVEGAILPVVAIVPVLLIHPAKPFELLPIADSKAYLNLTSIIQYYLCCPEFFNQRSDNALVTDSRNTEASCLW
jgi:hypothetical protein